MAHQLQSGGHDHQAWQCEESTKMRDYSDKCHSVYDSGCISGANLSSDLSLSEDLSTRSSRPCSFTDIPAESVVSDSKSYNREDSGLDLAEPFSGLSLEYNDLGKQPSQCQTTNLPKCNVPTVESTTVLPQDNSLSLQALEFYQQNEDGNTELHLAVDQGFIEAVCALVRMAPQPHLLDIQNYDGQTALHLSVLTGQASLAKRLVAAGASLAPRDAYGNTALHLAAETGDAESLRAVLQASADAGRPCPPELEQRNYDGMMCVHVAAARGHTDVLRCLISAGANVNARDAKSGRTVLHLVVEMGRRDVVHMLLEEAPQLLHLEATTYAGLTAYQLAVCYDAMLAERLANRGARPQPFPEDDSSEDEEEMYRNYHHQLNFFGGPINASA